MFLILANLPLSTWSKLSMIFSWVRADGSAAACFKTASAAPDPVNGDCEKYLLRLLVVVTPSARDGTFVHRDLGRDVHLPKEPMHESAKAAALTVLFILILGFGGPVAFDPTCSR
jgi:hypothetical protein